VWTDIWHLEAHHSTALEGNTLVLREVTTLLDQGRAVGAKPLKEYMEVKGYGDAASWVYREAIGAGDRTTDTLITVQEVRHIHHLAMSPVWQVSPHPDATEAESPGNFRRHDIHPFTAGMTPPSWPLVPAGLDEWVATTNTIPARLHGGGNLPELLAEAHNHFQRVHQFIDGKLPMIPFPDFGTGLAHVDDIAAGLVLILDKGEIGECYILTEANHSMGDIVGTVAKVAGRKAPKRNMPTGLLKMLRPVGPLVGKLMNQPPNLAELISSADNVTFWADASKARNELGFRPRDLETGMRETIEAEGWLK